MKYVSFDIETTGLEPGKHSIIELGAVIDDFEGWLDELPEFRCLIDNDTIVADSYALGMHADNGLLKELQDPGEDTLVLKPEEVATAFKEWMMSNGIEYETYKYESSDKVRGAKVRPVGAGKNLQSFDIPHLQTLPNWEDHIRFHHRVLDPGPLYLDPSKDDTTPNLSTCMERAGFEDTETSHTAVDDSLDVVKLLRRAYGYRPEQGGKVTGTKLSLPFE